MQAPMFEVVAQGHFLGVTLSGCLEPPVRLERALAVGFSFPVDQAQGGGADAIEVFSVRHQLDVAAVAARVSGPGVVRTAFAGPMVMHP